MLDRMEEAGLVRRARSEEDRRRVLVEPTEDERRLEKGYLELSEEMTGIFYRGMSEREIDRFEAYLERIHRNLVEVEGEEE
jgi:DNA-binding MarR family transcriptional regulator